MAVTRTTGYAFVFVLAFASSVAAQNIVLKNDSLTDDYNGLFTVQVFFSAGEEGQVWLTSPICGTIVAVEVMWGSFNAPVPPNPVPVPESEIGIFESGVFPARSNTYLQQDGLDAKIVFPPLLGTQVEGTATVHVFTDIIPEPTVAFPMAIPVDAGQTFVIALRFANTYTGKATDPTIMIDTNGCTAEANAAHVPSGVPCLDCDLCGIGFLFNDFVMRAIVQPNPNCPADTDDDCDVGILDFLAVLAQWGQVCPCPTDTDDDGNVGIDDFLKVLADWGPCP